MTTTVTCAVSRCLHEIRSEILYLDGWTNAKALEIGDVRLELASQSGAAIVGLCEKGLPRPDVQKKLGTSDDKHGFRFVGALSRPLPKLSIVVCDTAGRCLVRWPVENLQQYDVHAVATSSLANRPIVPRDDSEVFAIKLAGFGFRFSLGSFAKPGVRLSPTHEARINGTFEPETQLLLKALVRTGDTVIEIGACYGEFSLVLSRLVGPTGRVISFEPEPRNFPVLTRNLELNQIANVEAQRAFIFAKIPSDGPSPPPDATEDPSAVGQRNRDRFVPLKEQHDASGSAIVLSRFIRDRGLKPRLIFMDIEGAEVGVLHDLTHNLPSETRPLIVFERHELDYVVGKGRAFIEKLATSAGYGVKNFTGLTLLEPVS